MFESVLIDRSIPISRPTTVDRLYRFSASRQDCTAGENLERLLETHFDVDRLHALQREAGSRANEFGHPVIIFGFGRNVSGRY